jgi:hypothetical protein
VVAYYKESNIKFLTLARVLLVILALAMLSVGVFAVLVVSWVALSTGGAAASADEFLTALNDGDGPRAYSMVSSSMLREQTQQRFDFQLASLGPARFQLRSLWRRTLPEAGTVVLTGTMQNESGRLAPFAISMAKEDGWKVLSVTDRFDIDVGPGVWFRGMPAESEVRRFLETTLLDLNEAALAHDYSLFLNKIPGTGWIHIRNSPITGSFDRLAEEGIDYAGIAGMEAVFDEPPGWHIVSKCGAFGGGCSKVGEGTIWIAAGHYPLKQFSVRFQLIYTYQHPDWVLDCAFNRECFVTIGPQG